MEYSHVKHGFPPFYRESSEKLILGSFPSPKSREYGFYYGHPQNRFWKVLSIVYDEETPKTIDDKKLFLTRHGIALWDSIEECDIIGASDSSIRNPIPCDIPFLLSQTHVRKIFSTGKASLDYYNRLILPKTGIPSIYLPSTSPANAAFSLEMLVQSYSMITE